ncbi:dephospho-CoA kinase [Idiomarina seosinensis]|uniref:dephospho-CoA kinase n=1 Tax=Idiomarina seosinensis TaxID=281739 RepID=UPI00384A9856
MANYVVGLTGGIGSGKTAASDYLAGQGIDVVDADVIARQVVAPDSPCLAKIVSRFGKQVIHSDGSLNRQALRQKVFSDDSEKNWLNQLLHPAIRSAILQQLAQSQSVYTLLVAPLLLENGLDSYCQRVLVVDVPEPLQVERTVKRDNSEAHLVEAIMAAQMERRQRLARADDVVLNDGSLKHLQQQLDGLDTLYRQAAASEDSG